MQMIKTLKVMLLPNNKQQTKMFQSSGVARFAFNWALETEKKNYEAGGKFLGDGELRRRFTQLKKQPEYAWLNEHSNNVAKQAIKDACTAYLNFFKKRAKYPKFKSKRKSRPSFYVDTDKVEFSDTHVKLEKIADSTRKNRKQVNWIKLAEKSRIPVGCKYINPRVTFDGINWWISVGIECDDVVNIPTNRPVGIDIGIKDLAVCSDENTYENINKTNTVRKLKKKQRRLQRKVSNKYESSKEGNRYKKTCNIIKCEKQLLKINHRLANIRQNHLHQASTEIVNREPKFIVMEDLNVKGMMKNRHLAKAVQEQGLAEFYRQMAYKTAWHNIQFITADKWFPSSKTCSVCGQIKKDLKLSDRVYTCDCGFSADRDYNASVNLREYGYKVAA